MLSLGGVVELTVKIFSSAESPIIPALVVDVQTIAVPESDSAVTPIPDPVYEA